MQIINKIFRILELHDYNDEFVWGPILISLPVDINNFSTGKGFIVLRSIDEYYAKELLNESIRMYYAS